MKAGDILLFKGRDWLSRLIEWGTDSRYSHVAVCVSPEMRLAIEAIAGGGVRARDIKEIKERYDIYRVRQGYHYDLNGVVSYLVSRLNSGYDYLGVLFLGLLKALAKAYHPIMLRANRWQRERDYFCSELCYAAFNYGGGLDIVPDVPDADITSPGDIARSRLIETVDR